MYKVILFSFLVSTSCSFACLRNEYVQSESKSVSYKADIYPVLRAAEENNVLAHAVEFPGYNEQQVRLAQLRRALKASGE
jgi:hypothetical protein